MHDKVLGFIRETLLHENFVESLPVALEVGEVRLNLLQPNQEYQQYPDPELLLTFSGVREFAARLVDEHEQQVDAVLGIECTAEGGLYRKVASTGLSSASAIRMRFTGLSN